MSNLPFASPMETINHFKDGVLTYNELRKYMKHQCTNVCKFSNYEKAFESTYVLIVVEKFVYYDRVRQNINSKIEIFTIKSVRCI